MFFIVFTVNKLVKTDDQTGSEESAANGTPAIEEDKGRYISYGALERNVIPGSPAPVPANPYTPPPINRGPYYRGG